MSYVTANPTTNMPASNVPAASVLRHTEPPEPFYRSPHPHYLGVNAFVNATARPLYIYNDVTGEIVAFDVVAYHQRRHALKQIEASGHSAVIVAEKNLVKRLKNAGSDLSELAYIRNTSPGRFDSEVLHVVWDENRKSYHTELRPACQPSDIAVIVSASNRDLQLRLSDTQDISVVVSDATATESLPA